MDRGFTIIEVLMFISISGLIVMMVLTGFSNSIETTQRTDTTKSFEAALEAEYTTVGTGAVARAVDADGKVPSCTGGGPIFPGTSDNCLVVGKLLKIKQDTSSAVSSYNVVADLQSTPTTCPHAGVKAILECYNARVIRMDSPAGTITPEWTAQVSGVAFQSKTSSDTRTYDSSDVVYIAILRDPGSELVYIAPLRRTNDLTSGPYTLRTPADNELGKYENAKGQICLKHDGFLSPTSYIRFTGGEGVASIDSSTDPLMTGAPSC